MWQRAFRSCASGSSSRAVRAAGACVGLAAVPVYAAWRPPAACEQRPKYVLAIDQGTTSTRAILFDRKGNPVQKSQHEFTQIYPKPGWAEHDPMEILDSVETVLFEVMHHARALPGDVAAVGITNQRETTVAWDKTTGKPLYNALVWLDLRTADVAAKLEAAGGLDRFRKETGLPVSTYFSAVKMRWLIENVPEVATAVKEGRCMFGTIDSWLIYNLTGGAAGGGRHLTDVTNASRYMLMNLKSLAWDPEVCRKLEIPINSLPEIRSNSEELGRIAKTASAGLAGVPITCSIGDQQGALLGQACLSKGEVKSTYGTGCFIVMNTGTEMMPSTHGLLTTMGFKLGTSAPTFYALEGAVATAGRGIQWLRDSLKIIEDAPAINKLAGSVPDTGGVTFVPAFSGLLAPHWRPDARGALLGLSLHSTDAHVAHALLEGIMFQAADVKLAMLKDANLERLEGLKADGGLTNSKLGMQIQADLLGAEISVARMAESSALGAAFAAGLAVGFWQSPDDIRGMVSALGYDIFKPKMEPAQRRDAYRRWQSAVKKSFSSE